MMKKRLVAIFGPLVGAAVLLGVLFFGPWKINASDPKILAQASTSMSNSVLRGNVIKNEAIETGRYVPFFGSSELNRVSSMHPSVLAQKYNRNYTPFLLGAAGTQSLTQFSITQSMAEDLAGKKAVFIVSPQWFVPKGVKEPYFDNYYSEQQLYGWLLSLTEISDAEKYYAGRLLEFTTVNHNPLTVESLEQVKSGKQLTDDQKSKLTNQLTLSTREDELFGGVGLGKNLKNKIDKEAEKLPHKYEFSQLVSLANKEGRSGTSNNSLGIKNTFYANNLQDRMDKMKGSQKNLDYRFGPEFSDFQLVLDAFAKNNVDVLFIIPPINQKWMAHTGLPEEVLSGFGRKINYQLTSQGFTNVADFTAEGNVDYFMEDTIHLGWRGWLAADEAIKAFMEGESTTKPEYHLDSQFLSKEWQKTAPDAIVERQN